MILKVNDQSLYASIVSWSNPFKSPEEEIVSLHTLFTLIDLFQEVRVTSFFYVFSTLHNHNNKDDSVKTSCRYLRTDRKFLSLRTGGCFRVADKEGLDSFTLVGSDRRGFVEEVV